MAKDSISMIAKHPLAGRSLSAGKVLTIDGNLHPVEALADGRGIPAPALAGICRAKGWSPGKQVTEEEFDQAVEAFGQRPMGGGKI